LTEQGFRGETVDPGDLALQTAIGGAAGSLGARLGPLASKLGRKAGGKIGGKVGGWLAGKSARHGVSGRADLLKGALASETPFAFARGLLVGSLKELGESTGATGVALRTIQNLGASISQITSQRTSSGSDAAKDAIHSETRLDLNRNRKSAYGEFIHYRFWTDFMELAGRPLPNNPNNLLTSF
jgi:hypothetical protein